MNMPHFPRPLALATALGLLLTAVGRAEAVKVIKFSDPTKPGTVRISLARGDVRVDGADAPDVVVKSEVEPEAAPARKDGLRVLTETRSFSLGEKDNVVTLDALSEGWMSSPSDFRVTVPRGTSVIISNSLGGDIRCAGLSGDLEVKSLNGEVQLTDISGSALVETVNGAIDASIHDLPVAKPLSFTSTNGAVVVRVPANAKANVRLRTQNGSILTDFDDKALVTKVEAIPGTRRGKGFGMLTPEAREAFKEAARAGAEAARKAAEAVREAAEAAREGAEGATRESHGKAEAADVQPLPPLPPLPPVPVIPAIPTLTGGKLVTGTLNGGGPEIDIATMNGDVTLRRIEK